MSLPTVTVDDVLSWGPCHSETKVRELAAPLGDRFDALAILRAAHITAADRLWTVLREEMIPAPILHEFACRSAEWALVLVALGGAEIDPRSAEAIATKRRWLRREASDKELSAARSAAKRAADAAWSAAKRAARGAAEAAWSAAEAAGSAAWSAAWSAVEAAWSAARIAAEAAWSAADDIRVEGLLALLAEIGRAESEVAP